MPPGTRILTNLPLPAVEGFSIRTFGDYLAGGPGPEPLPDAAGLQGTVAIPWRPERERRDLADILPHIPAAEKPDILVLSSPEYIPIPRDVASFPGVRILLITDWNVCLRFLPDLCPLFDFCFTDWPGYRLLRHAGLANVHHQPMFGHDPAVFRMLGKPRNLDVSFCGNLNAGLHGERNRLLARVARWGRGRSLHLSQAFGAEYVDILNRSRLVFNHSIRGEANMRLFETMACGAVPLIEASNREIAILFQEGTHYFRYEPDRLEATLDALLSDPARLEAASQAARSAVAHHTKASQIRSLLEFAGKDAASRPSVPASAPSAASRTALVKLRVLGAGYSPSDALEEIAARSSACPDLERETLPGILLSLLEANPKASLGSARLMLERFLSDGSQPEAVLALFRMRLELLSGRWQEAWDWSRRCLAALDSLDEGASPDMRTGDGALRGLYRRFYAPVDLGKGFNTDLNAAFREDLAATQAKPADASGTGSQAVPGNGGARPGAALLRLLRCHCLMAQANILMAADRARDAVACAERVPATAYASLDILPLLAKAYSRLGEGEPLRAVLRDWAGRKPLDTSVWEAITGILMENAGRTGGADDIGNADETALRAYLDDILILAERFLPPDQVRTIQALRAERQERRTL